MGFFNNKKYTNSSANDIVYEEEQITDPRCAPKLKPNQLIPGIYTIGKDIPAGKYDFHTVWGSGSIYIFEDKNYFDSYMIKKESSKIKFSKLFDLDNKYCPLDIIAVTLKEGNILDISGNGIISIKKSQNVVINI